MSAWSPQLLKILLISVVLSLMGYWGTRLLKTAPLTRQRNFISLVMIAVLVLPLLVCLSPEMMNISLPSAEEQTPLLIGISQKLVVSPVNKAAPVDLLDITLLVWMAGTVLGVLNLIWGILGVRRTIRHARELSREEIAELESCAPPLSPSLPLHRVRLSDHVKGPVSAGFIRPWIILPRILFTRIEGSERRAIILHEWAHMENRDGLFSLLAESISAIYWWNPLIRALGRQRIRLQELISDQLAVSRSAPLGYAKALLSLAEKNIMDRSLLGVMAFFGPISLKERIERILNKEGEMNNRKMQKSILVFGTLAMTLMLVASGTRFVMEEIQDSNGNTTTVQQDGDGEKILKVPSTEAPKLIKRVEPKYPREALKKRISGQVTMTATIDLLGKVEAAEVLSGHPLLNEAALAALKSWEYEPFRKDGKTSRVQFTVVMSFKLFGGKDEKSPALSDEPLRINGSAYPKLVKRVEPEYPKEALRAGVMGRVVLEALLDIQGRVSEVRHVETEDDTQAPEYSLLVDSAKAAVKQWTYEPYIVKGKAKPVKFNVILTFKLEKDKEAK